MDEQSTLRPETNEVSAAARTPQERKARPGPELTALDVLKKLAIPLETLANLSYLALERANDPESVRQYMRLAQDQMTVLRNISIEIVCGPDSRTLPTSES
jgi:hypothetical protein